jgi:hypothetical protein
VLGGLLGSFLRPLHALFLLAARVARADAGHDLYHTQRPTIRIMPHRRILLVVVFPFGGLCLGRHQGGVLDGPKLLTLVLGQQGSGRIE